jgi:hypothetical protein
MELILRRMKVNASNCSELIIGIPVMTSFYVVGDIRKQVMRKREEKIDHPGERCHQNDEAGDDLGNKDKRHFLHLSHSLEQADHNADHKPHKEHRGGNHQGDPDGLSHDSNDKIDTHERWPPSVI